MTTYQDNKILENDLRLGKEAAFEYVYKNYFKEVASNVFNRSGALEDAQDIFQEALIVLVKKLRTPDFELTAKVSTYLYAVGQNLWLHRLRGAKKTTTVDFTVSESFLGGLQDDQIEVKEFERQTSVKERLVAINFEKLKDDCRKVLKSFYLQRSSLADIAVEMGYTPEFAKLKKFRCMEAYKKLVAEDPDYKNLNR